VSEGTPGVLAVLGSDLDVEYLRATLNPLDGYVVLVDDAEMLYNAPNSEILERIIVSGRDADHGLVLAGTTADLSSCYSGFIAMARKSRRGSPRCGVLVAVDTPDEGECSASGCRATPGWARSAAACCSARAARLRSSSPSTRVPSEVTLRPRRLRPLRPLRRWPRLQPRPAHRRLIA
jgi:hypothetical protein